MTVYEQIRQHTGNGCEIDKTIAINRLILARTFNVKQRLKYHRYITKSDIKVMGYPVNIESLKSLNSEIDLLREALSEFPEYNQMPNYITAIKLLNGVKF